MIYCELVTGNIPPLQLSISNACHPSDEMYTVWDELFILLHTSICRLLTFPNQDPQ